MRSIVVGSLVVVALVACGPNPAQAQTPPIKPGLWQVHSQREVDGQKVQMPDMSERMRNLPPEARKQMEAMMKQRGVDMSGGGGDMKICLTRDSLDPSQWQKHQDTCTTDFSSRTSTAWKWRTTCTDPVAETDGEATFISPDAYTVKTVTRLTIQGKPSVTRMTLDSKWLGADCGDVKPVTSRP
jgi:hypothetical protein